MLGDATGIGPEISAKALPRALAAGADGHLEFVHNVTGVRTLRDEFDKVAAHNAHHLTQIRAALSRRVDAST
jgi:hypothetical protein